MAVLNVPVTLADNSITNAKLANMAQGTVKGRQTGSGTGDPEDLTPSQARTVLELGTAAVVNTGTGASDVPTITQADARYITPYQQSVLPTWTLGTQDNNTTGLIDITDSQITIPEAGLYEISYRVTYTVPATSTGACFTIVAGGSVSYQAVVATLDTQPGDNAAIAGPFNHNVPVASSRTTGTNHAVINAEGIFTAASSVRLQFRTEVGGSTLTVTGVTGYIRRKA